MAGFGRGEELESDREGLALANKVGYAPAGLGDFLTRLADRNQRTSGKQGLFASHPEMKERLDDARQGNQSAEATRPPSSWPTATRRTSPTRQRRSPRSPRSRRAPPAWPAARRSRPSGEKAAEAPKKKGFGLSGLIKPVGTEKKSAEVTGSAASRGVDTERNAKGGPVKTMVAVKVSPADLDAFRKEGNLKS